MTIDDQNIYFYIKSPISRYEDQDINGNQAVYLNAGRKPEDCKMVARALYSFQVEIQGSLFIPVSNPGIFIHSR